MAKLKGKYIDDGTITESKLDFNNSPTNNYVIKWNDSASKFEWVAPTTADAHDTKVSANDSTPGYLDGKLVIDTGKTTLTQNDDGGNETLTIGIGADIFDTTSNTTSDVTEGTKLFYTDARVSTWADTQKGENDGLAELGATGIVPTDQLPTIPADIDDLGDVDTVTSAPAKNETLKWNGSDWVPAVYDYSFTFSVASFTDNEDSTQLIGSGEWEAVGALSFDMTYNNGPATSGHIALSSDGSTTWASNLTLTSPFTEQVSALTTTYPTAKDKYVRFTLTATDGTDTDASKTATVTFRNIIYWGVLSKSSSFTDNDVKGLANSDISNDYTRTMTLAPSTGEYMIFAYPSSYTSIPDGTDYETDGGTGFKFDSIACAFNSAETVSIENSAGFTENYKVFASTEANLGSHSLVTVTSSSTNTINPLYYGITEKTTGFTEADIEGLANNLISNTNARTWGSVTSSTDEYLLWAMPKRLGTVTFWAGGFEGGFEDPDTVSVTNSNGWTEDYYVWRSTNSNIGATVVTTQ